MAASDSRHGLPSSGVPSCGLTTDRNRHGTLVHEMVEQLRKLPPELVFLSEKKVALLLDISLNKLQRDRSKGLGISYRVMGARTIRYRLSDVLRWIDGTNGLTSTSDPGTKSDESSR